MTKISFLMHACTGAQAYDEYGRDDFGRNKNGNGAEKGGPTLSKLGSNSTAQLYPKDDGEERPAAMPPASVMTRLILIMVWRKLIRNPNTYSSLIGVIWSLVSYRSTKLFSISQSHVLISHTCTCVDLCVVCAKLFRWGIEMPAIIARSIAILSDAGLGMAMFSLGLYISDIPLLYASVAVSCIAAST